jgi:alginate O-acetyltransferase complex protein AlgJ
MQGKTKHSITALLPGLVFALVLILGLASSAVTMLSAKGLALLRDLELVALAEGQTTEAQSRLLNDELLAGETLATTARVIDWLVAGDLGPQVRRGCEGWLFLREELDVRPNAGASMTRRAAMLGRVAKILKTRGIALVAAIAPDKSRIEAERLCGLRRPLALADRLQRFNTLVAEQGVDAVDLASVLSSLDGERYFRTDTHWNEQGARAAANTIAGHLAGKGLTPPPGAPVEITAKSANERVGDLIGLAGLAEVGVPLRPAGDHVAESTIVLPQPVSDDLLGEMAGPPVVVVGSSYSRNANFIGFLAAALAAPVGDMAKDGAKFAGSAMAYFNNAAFRETPPKVIVWEIPERDVDAPFNAVESEWEARLAGDSLSALGSTR